MSAPYPTDDRNQYPSGAPYGAPYPPAGAQMPGYGAPGYQGGYAPPPSVGFSNPGYPPQTGYPQQPGYPPQTGYPQQPGYPPQAGK
ncbi:CLUMA_CG006541, isoform A [Clunio marinus]|uniref:CLUMA_CG006541, isoform A n=1 Tax=Clunio marinus TaxID=568069 RepID=A0A1J1HYJ3_9DIPT|nr:CLUMA_CG006541, isoform A [Clunio marinus]